MLPSYHKNVTKVIMFSLILWFTFLVKYHIITVMNEMKYSNSKIYSLIRVAAIVAAIIILLVNGYIYLEERILDRVFSDLVLSYRFLSVICVETLLIILIIFPYKLESIAIFAFIHSGALLYTDPLNILSVLMFFLGIVSLYYRGLLKRQRTLKISLLIVGGLTILLSNLRFGKIIFLQTLEDKIICMLVCFLIFIFIIMGRNQMLETNPVLDLSAYKELTDRDKEWIELALSQEKYDNIARKYNLSPNYVKNRMRIIFKILGVPDRLALLATYSGCTIKKDE